MTRRYAIPALALLGLAAAGWFVHARPGHAGTPAVPTADRQSVQLTVYADDFALVREVRPSALTAGPNRLQLTDVSRLLDPESVLLRWEGTTAALPQIVAHAYDIGVDNGDQLLKRYLGQSVTLIRYGNDGHEAGRQDGTLMNDADGQVVLQSDGNFYVNPPGTLVVPAQSGVVTIPQLSVQVDSPTAQSASLDMAYLTRGLSWNSDYVGTLAPHGNALSLECWATVTNRTGTDYPDANVTLIAGSPNRAVRQEQNTLVEDGAGAVTFASRAPMHKLFAPNLADGMPMTVGDFHAYRLQRPTTVMQEQMNRLLLLSSADVPVQKDYSAALPTLSAWDDGEETSGPPQHGDVALSLTFFNRPKDGLGAPLPAGAVRLYEPDSTGTLRYAGAAQIADTPRDQKVTLTLDKAFDVFTERRVVQVQKRDKHTWRKRIEVVLHNEKSSPVSLRLVQPFAGRWRMAGESLRHVNLDASHVQWTASVPAGGQTVLTYTVDFSV